MTTLRRLFGLSLTRLLSLAAACIGAAAGLFFAYVRFINPRLLAGALSPRRVDDSLVLGLLMFLAGLYMAARPETVISAPPRRDRFRWRVTIPLGVLILLAAFLRFHNLGFQSLWHDEFLTNGHVTSDSLFAAVNPTGRIFDSWPAFHIPLYVFVHLAGDTEFALRLPSALAGVLLVPVVFVIGRRMFSDREGLLAAGLVASLGAAVEYSQEARMYGLLMLQAGLSGYFWFCLAQDVVWRRPPRRFMTLGYAATIILMAYTHYFGLILIGLEGLGFLLLVVSLRRIPLPFVAAFLACGLAYLPWMPLLFKDASKSVFWLLAPDSSFKSGVQFLSFLYGKPFIFAALVVALIGLAVVLWPALQRRRDAHSLPLAIAPGFVLASWFVMPFLIAYVRSIMSTPILLDRYLLISLPAAYLLLARAVTRLPLPRLGQGLVGAGLLIFAVANILTGPYYTVSTKPELRQAIQYLAGHAEQSPGALIIGSSEPIAYYYPRFSTTDVGDLDIAPLNEDLARQAIGERKPRYIWFMGQQFVYNRSLPDSLAGDYVLRDEQEFYLVSLLLYERK